MMFYHATVVPRVGFSPISHMGHSYDLGNAIADLPPTRYVGISVSNNDIFSVQERAEIIQRQWHMPNVNFRFVTDSTDLIVNAFNNLPSDGYRILHLLAGHDEYRFINNLKKSLENNKVEGMMGKKWNSIYLHLPPKQRNVHNMSGTKMRLAAWKGDTETFQQHLGPMFKNYEVENIQNRIKEAIDLGNLPLIR